MDKHTHPWICRECTAAEKEFIDILKATSSHLYLLWFLNPGDTSAPIDQMGAQWKAMHQAYTTNATGLSALIPLCAFTDAESKVRDLSNKDNKWHPCTESQVFPQPSKAQLPYGLWCLSVGGPIRSNEDMTNRFCLDQGTITDFKAGYESLDNIDKTLQNSILAQALALQWLARNKEDETTTALNAALE